MLEYNNSIEYLFDIKEIDAQKFNRKKRKIIRSNERSNRKNICTRVFAHGSAQRNIQLRRTHVFHT